MNPNRRRCLQAGLGSLALYAATGAPALLLLPTPHQTRGPFYPRTVPADHDHDLVRVAGRGDAALGEITHLHGRVSDPSGQPLNGAQVEIWQCDARGYYHHVHDRAGDARDTSFQGYGRTRSDAGGGYHFRTIKPVAYPGRTPHIHLQVSAPGRPQLSTQVYVRGLQSNTRDFLFARLDGGAQARVQADFEPVDAADAMWSARFDVIVPAA